jgi:hypothetical protein
LRKKKENKENHINKKKIQRNLKIKENYEFQEILRKFKKDNKNHINLKKINYY